MVLFQENPSYPLWIAVPAIALLIFGALGLVDSIDREADRRDADARAAAVAAASVIESRKRELARGYDLCPPAAPGMTNVLMMVVRSAADEEPEVVSCARLAERPFTPRARRQSANPPTLAAQVD